MVNGIGLQQSYFKSTLNCHCSEGIVFPSVTVLSLLQNLAITRRLTSGLSKHKRDDMKSGVQQSRPIHMSCSL